jgi:hypothetical protein
MVLMLCLLRDWYPNILTPEKVDEIDRVSAMLLQDLYVHPQIVLDHKPKTLAIAVFFSKPLNWITMEKFRLFHWQFPP